MKRETKRTAGKGGSWITMERDERNGKSTIIIPAEGWNDPLSAPHKGHSDYTRMSGRKQEKTGRGTMYEY